jgi:hypothetical protein
MVLRRLYAIHTSVALRRCMPESSLESAIDDYQL